MVKQDWGCAGEALPFDAADWMERLRNVGGDVQGGVVIRASGEVWKTGVAQHDGLCLQIDPTDARQWAVAEEVRGVADAAAEIWAALKERRVLEAILFRLQRLRDSAKYAAAKPEDRVAQAAAISIRADNVAALRAAGVPEEIIQAAVEGKGGQARP